MSNIESVSNEIRIFNPPQALVDQANISGMPAYLALCAEAEKDYTLLFNNIITAPVQLQEELLKSEFTAKEEKLGDEDVLHLEKPAKGKEAAVHFWLCKEPEMKNMIFLRKADLIVSGTDLELPATITYSKLTEPVKITAPDAK